MKFHVTHNPQGDILGCVSDNMVFQDEGNVVVCDHFVEPNDYYVDIGDYKVKPKKAMNILTNKTTLKADGKDFIYISGIPEGSSCFYEGDEHIVNEGVIEFTATQDGTYTFRFACHQYVDYTLKLEATT